MAFNVGDTVLYKMDGESKKLRGKEGTITKIVDGKKTVKFKGVAEPVMVKAVNMVVLDLKKEVGRAKPPRADGDLFRKGDEVVYFYEAGPGRFGDVKFNGEKGLVTSDQEDAAFVEVAFKNLNGGKTTEWYAYNIKLDVAFPAPEAVREVPAPLPPEQELPAAPAEPAPVAEAQVDVPYNQRQLYLAQQKLLGWKKGDAVRVVRAAGERELGWNNAWTREMDEFIGEEFLLDEDTNKATVNGIRLGDFSYPWFVLQWVRAAEVAEVVVAEEEFDLDGIKFRVNKDLILVGERLGFNAGELIEKLALAHAKVQGIAA